jgi:hypothetical protein
MDAKLTQQDFEQLSAFLDGELGEADQARAEERLAADGAWRRARARLEALDRALDAYAVPAAPAGLVGRILRKTTRQRAAVRWAWPRWRYLAPLAAAAALVAALLVYHALRQPAGQGPNLVNSQGPIDPSPLPEDTRAFEEPRLAELDVLVEDNLDFFRDLGVVNNLDTIEAIYSQQQMRSGGT